MPSVPYDSYNYASFWIKRKYENQAERIALLKLLKKIPSREKLLDIGGGYGRLADLYSPMFKQCTIVEPSENLIKQGLKIQKKFSNLSFIKGNSEQLPNNSFDLALMIRVSHHLPDISPTFKAVYQSLSPEGYFIIDVANKIHFLARIKAYLKGNFTFTDSVKTVDIRSAQAIKEDKIIFVNHHPRRIENLLKESGFTVVDKLSVSNFRNSYIKKVVPEKILLFLEGILQKLLASLYFGPSIFYLCKKV